MKRKYSLPISSGHSYKKPKYVFKLKFCNASIKTKRIPEYVSELRA